MARFNAAFMSGSVDEKFQNRYNYLLDLLDTGYIVEKMIGNSMSRIEVSPSVGIKISYGTTDRLSIDPTTGDLRFSGDIYIERLRASGDIYLNNGNNIILKANATDPTNTGDIVFQNASGGEYCRLFPLADTHLYRRYGGVNNKIWDSGNDGSGSTLDADLLDGQHGSYYFSSAYLSGRSLTDANNADVDGFMVHQLLSTASNKPTGTDHSLLTLSYNSAWSTQMAGDWRTNQWYVRTQNNGTWTSWKELWNSGSLPIEEGSWSPSVINSLNLTGITITSARYYRIGKLVQCWVAGSCSITATNTRTYFSISNPFNQINTGYPQGGGGGFQQSVSPFTNVAARIADDSGSTSNTAMLAQSAWTGSSSFSMCYSYQCA